MALNLVYETLHLYISENFLTFEPVESSDFSQKSSLVLNRSDSSIVLHGSPPFARNNILDAFIPIANDRKERLLVYGLLGFISINQGDLLIVATKREKAGVWNGHAVYKLTGYKIIPVHSVPTLVSPLQKRDDLIYTNLIKQLLDQGAYYFSYSRDLTRCAQSAALLAYGANVPLWERADDRFFWNHFMMERMTLLSRSQSPLYAKFILPLICGFFHTTQISPVLSYTLISRRSRFRAGARYHSRGIDESGHVSNFVETEQVVRSEDIQQSFVQIRGSIPLFWQQVVGIKYKPKLILDPRSDTSLVFKQHFKTMFYIYGPQIAVNLINKTGYEKPLGEEFARQVGLLNDVQLRYVHFDFHHECRKMQWHRLSILINQIQDDLDKQGYCVVGHDMKIYAKQYSTVRTNCIDCLDRTNVFQSLLAKIVLEKQFQEIRVLPPGASLESLASFYSTFRNVWADHADAISMQYSGTGALKTDFTRTGKRSPMGVIQDLSNSILRYIKNHYIDGERQDAFDLGLGVYRVNLDTTTPFHPYISRTSLLTFCAGIVIIVLLLLDILMPERSFIGNAIVFVAVVSVVFVLLNRYENDLVSRPRLKKAGVIASSFSRSTWDQKNV